MQLLLDICPLTHWGRMTHICVSKLTIIGSDNGLVPDRRQAIIWTNAGILLIRTLGTNFSEILGEIYPFSFSKMHLKMSSAKWRLFGLGLNELKRTAGQSDTSRSWVDFSVVWPINIGQVKLEISLTKYFSQFHFTLLSNCWTTKDIVDTMFHSCTISSASRLTPY